MKVSVNWIKQFVDFELPPVDELVTKIGAQLGAVEEIIDIGAKYNGVLVAKVVSCEKHPNADKLHVCAIDDGGNTPDVNRDENGYVQVVCGAPNVREGLMVAWIPPKAIVPSTYNTSDPFTLEARELRGVVSNGMLASGKELEINDDHNGILEIDEDVQPGQSFADVYELNDYIIDIENKMFTHRPDLFGQLGVAREIAGILEQKFTSPDWYLQPLKDVLQKSEQTLPLEVRNEIPELVPRFMAVAMSGIEVKPSPIKLQTYLSRVGIKPINNIVDITNYVMMLTAQPLHAYDYDKVKNLDNADTATLVVRKPHEGEKLMLLGGKEIEPRTEAILIASATKPVALGGVMGGAETEVDENTKNIILECANFDMYSIRRTSMVHGLFTDAVTRFNKGQSPLQNAIVIAFAVNMIQQYAPGSGISSEIKDVHGELQNMPIIDTSVKFVNDRLGLQLDAEKMVKIVRNVEFDLIDNPKEINGSDLHIGTPFWRTDISIPEDIVEEVGRLYGYDNLLFELPKRSITPVQKDTLLATKSKIRTILSESGANEVLTYSFVHGDLLEKVGQDKELAYQLSNALSPELQYYRLSLTPSLLEKVHPNSKAGHKEFVLFELGKGHLNTKYDNNNLPLEFERVAVVLAADEKLAQQRGAAYYQAKRYLTQLLENFVDIERVRFAPIEEGDQDQATKYYDLGRSATVYIDDIIIGRIGEYTAGIRRALKLPDFCAGFELGVTPIIEQSTQGSPYVALPKYPKVSQDITLQISANTTYAMLIKSVRNYLDTHKPENTRLTLAEKDIYQKDDSAEYRQITLGITIASYEKTMRESEVTKLLDGLKKHIVDNNL